MRGDLTPALAALLASTQRAFGCDLYTITLLDERVLTWTNADRAMTWAGVEYACGPGLSRTKVRMALGLEADALSLTVIPRPEDRAGAVSLRRAIARGDFDGATVRLDRGYAPAPGEALAGIVPEFFTGRVASIPTSGAGGYELLCKSPLALLDAPYPRNVYQPQCANVLYDSICRANPAAHSWTMTAYQSGMDDQIDEFWFTISGSLPDHTLNGGRVRFLSGANANRSMGIRLHRSGALYFAQPWPDPVRSGDTITAWRGCDKTMASCRNVFANLAHFRGQPFIPAPETTV